MRSRKARPGHRAGPTRHRRGIAYGQLQGATRSRGSPPSCTTSPRKLCGTRSMRFDGITWRDYEADLERKLADLHDRVQSGAYRATPSRRVYIPKPDGGQRPLAVAALEDKIVQRAVADVLNAIYEEDFLGFSYGFRPGRGAHDALDALSAAIYARKVNYIVDADIAKFFDSVSKKWLARSPENTIGEKGVLPPIPKRLRAGLC